MAVNSECTHIMYRRNVILAEEVLVFNCLTLAWLWWETVTVFPANVCKSDLGILRAATLYLWLMFCNMRNDKSMANRYVRKQEQVQMCSGLAAIFLLLFRSGGFQLALVFGFIHPWMSVNNIFIKQLIFSALTFSLPAFSAVIGCFCF